MTQAIFRDTAGNEWPIVIDIATIRRVRKDTGFEFGKCLNEEMSPWYEMLSDFELLTSVLYSILSPQVKEKGMTEETFLKNLHGSALDSARDAIWDAFAFFCPSQEREMLTTLKKAEEQIARNQKTTMETFLRKRISSELSSDSNLDHTVSAS